MVQIDYTINQSLPNSLVQEIAAQPNRVGQKSLGGTSYTFSFDHTPAQATAFKKWLNTRLGLYNDALSQYTNKRGATLVYTTTTPVTLTSIGTVFKNVYAVSDGLSFPVDSDVYDEVRIQVHWTKNGTGTQSLQIVDKSTPFNILASLSDLVSGDNTGSITAIPDVLKDTTKKYLIQVKSTVATDGPVFLGLNVMMR